MLGPLDVATVRQLLATLCVTSSLTLLALGDCDSTRWVLLLNPELWQTT
jgi:hypothetical protein